MANHTIDCEFCGKDQRLAGAECCEEAARAFQIKSENVWNERERLRTIIKQIDPDVCILVGGYLDKMFLKDVVRLIERAQRIAVGENL